MNNRNKNEYLQISPLILRPDSQGHFDIFLRHDNNFVLFNGIGRVFTAAKRQELIKNSLNKVYINKKAFEQYRAYLLENITDVLNDEQVPMEERAQAWSNTAAAMGKELFEDNLPGPAFEKRYQRFEKLIQSTSSFLQSPKSLKHLSKLISKGYETYHHGVSTMVYTICLMQEYDYDDYKTLACGMGAMLHDIGKQGLPLDLVNKNPAELTDDEKDIIAVHPMVGARTCATFNLPTIASNCILFHHERADGRGYPTKATAQDLPLHTKIVALCDKYDNLTRNRPYQKAISPFDALKTIMDDEGLAEKEVLKKFVTMLSQAEIV